MAAMTRSCHTQANKADDRFSLLTGHLPNAADVTVLKRLLPPRMIGRTRPLRDIR